MDPSFDNPAGRGSSLLYTNRAQDQANGTLTLGICHRNGDRKHVSIGVLTTYFAYKKPLGAEQKQYTYHMFSSSNNIPRYRHLFNL